MNVEAVVEAIALSDLPVARRREGLETTQKLIANIVKHPGEAKYRQIKKQNETIQKRLFPQCFELLCAAGFLDDGNSMFFHGDPSSELHDTLAIIESVLMSLPEAPAAPPASVPEGQVSSSSSRPGPMESKKTLQQKRQERAKEEAAKSQANSKDQLEALRRNRANRYQEEQDLALAQHLSGRDAEEPYDPIAALNASRGAVYSFVTCTQCGTLLRYSSATRAQGVLCPCGTLLQPVHLKGKAFVQRSPSDLPVEPGEPVDNDNKPRMSTGPFVTIRGPEGPARLPLHSVLQMMRRQAETQQSAAGDEAIEALPTRKFDGATSSGDKEDNKCQICMEDFLEGDELRTLPCFHLFHTQCVDQWLKVNSICPTCRHKIG